MKSSLSVAESKLLPLCLILAKSRAAERGGGGGGRGGGNGPRPRGAGVPEDFLLVPGLFCVLNISAQRRRYLFFGLNTEIWHGKLR